MIEIPNDDGFQESKTQYPWDIWLNHGTYVLEWGTDFKRSPKNFTIYIYKVARRRNKLITYKFHPWNQDLIMIRAYDKGTPKPALPNFPDGDENVNTPGVPRCGVCNEKLAGFALPYGECMEKIDGSILDLRPLHEKDENE